MKYIKGFDTVRAMAVFFVVIAHWGPDFIERTLPCMIKKTFIMNGTFGVVLFFVLSGFLITTILLNEKKKSNGRQQLTIIKNFFIRRSLRIFPIYYLLIAFCYFFNSQMIRDHIWHYLTYTSNVMYYHSAQTNPFTHTWSLAVEEQFYLIWPWAIIFISWRFLKYVPVLAIILGFTSKYIVLYVFHNTFPILVINCLDSFGIGALYAFVRLDKEMTARFEHSFKIVLPLMLFLLWRTASFAGQPLLVMFSRAVDDVICLAIIIFVMNNKWEWMRKYILENRVFNFIGKISYGLYLYHYPLGYAYSKYINLYLHHHPSMPPVLYSFYFTLLIKLIILLLVSILSYVLIEQPILKLKKRFEYT